MRMEHATASSASSDAVEIRLQELRSSAVTRGREWLQDALAKISVMELRKMAHARNVGRGPDNKWPIRICSYGSFCYACHGGGLETAVVLQHHGIEFRLATQCHTSK